MSDRVTQAIILVEMVPPNDPDRVTQALLQVEYTGGTNYDFVTQALVLVEYHKLWPGERDQGPAAGIV
jgi:hypothetical protein